MYERFALDESWDSPHNRKLLEEMPELYLLPGSRRATHTELMVFAGPDTLFPTDRARDLESVRAERGERILFAWAGADKTVPWTKPVDLYPEKSRPRECLRPFSSDGVHLVQGDLGQTGRPPLGIMHNTRESLERPRSDGWLRASIFLKSER